MNNKLLTMTLGAAVAIICLATILIPVLDDAQHAGADVYSNGVAKGDIVGERTVDMIVTNTHTIVVNGEEISGYNYEAVLSDAITVAVNASSINVFWTDGTTGHWSAINGANVHIDGPAKTVTLSDITHASSNDNISGNSLTVTYSDFCYYRSTSGEYTEIRDVVLSNYTVNNSDQVFAATQKGASTYIAWNDGKTYTNGAVGDSGISLTPVEGHPEVSTITSIAADTTTPSWVVVPAKVYGESVMGGMSNILGVIPLLIVAAIIVSIATVVVRARE